MVQLMLVGMQLMLVRSQLMPSTLGNSHIYHPLGCECNGQVRVFVPALETLQITVEVAELRGTHGPYLTHSVSFLIDHLMCCRRVHFRWQFWCHWVEEACMGWATDPLKHLELIHPLLPKLVVTQD